MSSNFVVKFGQRMCVFSGLMLFAAGMWNHTFKLVLLGAGLVALFVEVIGPVAWWFGQETPSDPKPSA